MISWWRGRSRRLGACVRRGVGWRWGGGWGGWQMSQKFLADLPGARCQHSCIASHSPHFSCECALEHARTVEAMADFKISVSHKGHDKAGHGRITQTPRPTQFQKSLCCPESRGTHKHSLSFPSTPTHCQDLPKCLQHRDTQKFWGSSSNFPFNCFFNSASRSPREIEPCPWNSREVWPPANPKESQGTHGHKDPLSWPCGFLKGSSPPRRAT